MRCYLFENMRTRLMLFAAKSFRIKLRTPLCYCYVSLISVITYSRYKLLVIMTAVLDILMTLYSRELFSRHRGCIRK